MSRILRMPEVLTGATEATITAWAVAEGDRFDVGTTLAEIETDKAVVDYAAEEEGWIGRLLVPGGTTVSVGEPIAILLSSADESVDDDTFPASDASPTAGAPQSDDGGVSAPPSSSPGADSPESADPAPVDGTTEPLISDPKAAGTTADAPVETGKPAVADAAATGSAENAAARGPGSRVFASPLARKLAREQEIPLDEIEGTGPGGRIVRADVDRAVSRRAEAPTPKAGTPTPPANLASAADGPTAYEEIPHTRMRHAIARRLTESKASVPHFYMKADCRVDDLLELRARVNESSPVKISVNDFVLKAVAAAFAKVPEANVVWTDAAMRRYATVDVAVAVTTGSDLVTPVVRGVESLTLSRLATATRDLADRARDKKLKQHELEGGTFTVSNLGMFGITEFSAILNPPHSGILAVGAARPVAVVDDGEVGVAQMMTCTLSADHRAVDGALAARWITAFQEAIESPYGLLV